MRSAVGGGGRFGAMHSQIHGTWFQGVPGLKIAMPSTPARGEGPAEGRDPRRQPGIFLEHKRLYSVKDEVPEPVDAIPLGQARIARAGGDLTIVSVGKGVRDALAAADEARDDGSRPRSSTCARCARSTSRPSSGVEKTNRLLVVEEGPRTGGWATGLLGAVAEEGLHDLDDAWIVATDETPVPYSPTLEDAFMPDAATIVVVGPRAARRAVGS